jgi:hypothetical protein
MTIIGLLTSTTVAMMTDPELTKKLSSPPDSMIGDKQENTSLLSRKAFIGSIAIYCIWSLHDMAYTEVLLHTYKIMNSTIVKLLLLLCFCYVRFALENPFRPK